MMPKRGDLVKIKNFATTKDIPRNLFRVLSIFRDRLRVIPNVRFNKHGERVVMLDDVELVKATDIDRT